jgi:uncharacterized protein (DUF1499 family)
MERVKIYLTANVAETRPDHPWTELRTPLVRADADATRAAVLAAMGQIGWRDVRESGGAIRAVVVSPLFRFRDDVTVRLEATEAGTLIHARSASRVGKGDLAANAHHLRELFSAVEGLVGTP